MTTEPIDLGEPLPPGLARTFGCTRAVIFHDSASGIPSVAGTGFLVELFGEIFFITARHVVDNNYCYDEQNLRIFYRPDHAVPIQFREIRRYTSLDPDDTDHVDVIVLIADRDQVQRHLFGQFKPYCFNARTYVRGYRTGDRLYFSGLSPATSTFDYEHERYFLHFSTGDLIYNRPSSLRSVHIAKADVHHSCPDFDGLSGSPIFHVKTAHDQESYTEFGGMLLRATRTSGIFHFLDAGQTFHYLLDYFLAGHPKADAEQKLEKLICWYHPDIGFEYRVNFGIFPKSTTITLLDGRQVVLDR